MQILPNGIPRRSFIPEWTAAEFAISNAMEEVEELGADVLLTEAVVLLGKAKDKVADYIEREGKQNDE